ncbi:glutathione S-transferase family protein [Alphaproteobacteria bacterium]|nr:glutathione S-transferase family protein [Alphaproteobacteria bacterium]
MTNLVKLHYFPGRGRAETTRWMLAINHIKFENIPIETPEMLLALRASGKLPFDQMPLLEIEELNLSQSSAMIRYLARSGEYYGSTEQDAVWCDMIAGAVSDFAETSLQAAFQPTKKIAVKALQERFNKFGPRFENRLSKNGLCAGVKLTFADILLAEAINSYLEWIPDILHETPFLDNLYKKVITTSGISAYLKSPQRYPMSGSNYVIDVARVLQRALPSHMPNPNRFI